MDEASKTALRRLSRAFCHVSRRIPGWMSRNSETASLAALSNRWLVLERIHKSLFASVSMPVMREAPYATLTRVLN
jgi:hypothetical protein